MLNKVSQTQKEVEAFEIKDKESLDQFRNTFLSKKGKISGLFDDFKTVSAEQKKEFGQKLNELKRIASEKLLISQEQLESKETEALQIDTSLPGDTRQAGSRHPLSIVRNQILHIFNKIGYNVSEGPEIEDDWHVFTALNFPLDHPARDMQDTFFVGRNPDLLLRTHTSSVQIRVMEQQKPPIRALFPGRVFRNEAISARAHCIFHQIEGLYVDKNVSFAELKQNLLFFAREMFGKDTQIRLRPSYFPFTEPSAEMDISCSICGGKGCNICKYSGWVEILGCGMVDPSVLDACGIDSKTYTGLAFGMGIERIAILKYKINDIRLFFENDVRFIKQFSSEE